MRLHRTPHAAVLFVGSRSFGVIDHRFHRPLFSERYGHGPARYWHIGPVCFRYRPTT